MLRGGGRVAAKERDDVEGTAGDGEEEEEGLDLLPIDLKKTLQLLILV